MSRRRDAVVRRGLRHIGRAIGEQPGMFTLAVLGSSLYGAMTVASACVIGEITDRVLAAGVRRRAPPRPARWRSPRPRSSASPSSRSSASSAAGSVAGDHAATGCRPTTAAGSPGSTCGCRCPGTSGTPPAAAVQRQLRRRGRLVLRSRRCRSPSARWSCSSITVGRAVRSPTRCSRWSGWSSSRWSSCVNVVYSQVDVARGMQRAQQLRAEVSEIAHESFDGALVVKTLGREDDETERFGGRAERAARRR